MKYAIAILAIGLIFLSGCITFSTRISTPKGTVEVQTNTPLEREANSIVKLILQKVYDDVTLISSATSKNGNMSTAGLKYKVGKIKASDLSSLRNEFESAGYKIETSSENSKALMLIAKSNTSEIILTGEIGSNTIVVGYQNLNK